jgi:hypothetical protein
LAKAEIAERARAALLRYETGGVERGVTGYDSVTAGNLARIRQRAGKITVCGALPESDDTVACFAAVIGEPSGDHIGTNGGELSAEQPSLAARFLIDGVTTINLFVAFGVTHRADELFERQIAWNGVSAIAPAAIFPVAAVSA